MKIFKLLKYQAASSLLPSLQSGSIIFGLQQNNAERKLLYNELAYIYSIQHKLITVTTRLLLYHNKQIRRWKESDLMMLITLLKSSELSSMKPKVYLVRECRTSRQWILSPLAMGRSKLTKARILGLGIPKGASRLAMKSDIWWKLMNCVACGSNLCGKISCSIV